MAGEKINRCAGTDENFCLQLSMMAMDPDFLLWCPQSHNYQIGRRFGDELEDARVFHRIFFKTDWRRVSANDADIRPLSRDPRRGQFGHTWLGAREENAQGSLSRSKQLRN